MPPVEPANLRAQARRDAGLPRRLQQFRERVEPDPSGGGSTGYPLWFRILQLQKFEAGEPIDVCLATIYNWRQRLLAFHQTGNRDRTQLVGMDHLLLVLFIIAVPDAIIDECAAFIFNHGGRLYSTQAILMRLDELQITQK